jgi:hypothetical protein
MVGIGSVVGGGPVVVVVSGGSAVDVVVGGSVTGSCLVVGGCVVGGCVVGGSSVAEVAVVAGWVVVLAEVAVVADSVVVLLASVVGGGSPVDWGVVLAAGCWLVLVLVLVLASVGPGLGSGAGAGAMRPSMGWVAGLAPEAADAPAADAVDESARPASGSSGTLPMDEMTMRTNAVVAMRPMNVHAAMWVAAVVNRFGFTSYSWVVATRLTAILRCVSLGRS